MKRNTMMRIASVLLVAVLLSTCTISGTFAKYVTKDEGMDAARVAKFGVVVDVAGTMFAETYDNVASGNDAVGVVEANITVNSDGTGAYTKLVAPGTNGKMADIKISGQPEVDVEVTYEAKVDLNGWATDTDSYYCPLVITINNDKYYLDAYTGEEEAENVIEAAIKDYTQTYNANTDLGTKAEENLKISWEWPFTTGEDNDIKDTYLGDAAAGLKEGKSAATISITVTTTVTQID